MRLKLAERLAALFPVRRVCEVLGVSPSGLYARRLRGESARVREDRQLKQKILEIHLETKHRYGTPRIEQALRASGTQSSRKRVARLRRELGLRTRYRRRFRVTTDSNHSQKVAPNRLRRQFDSSQADRIWVGDITYLRAGSSWAYLSMLLDTYSRRVVGWHLSPHLDEDLVRQALEKALALRRPSAGLLHHTDRGSQYCAKDYSRRLKRIGAVVSMSRKGDCWDNAMAESFFKTLKTELGSTFSSLEAARRELFAYIEGFYNTGRLHSSLGYRSPAQFERQAMATRSHGSSLGRALLPTLCERHSERPGSVCYC